MNALRFTRLITASLILGSCAIHHTELDTTKFVDISKIDASIRLDIRYATTNNFTGRAMYPSAKCMLRKDIAEKLVRVQRKLQQQKLGLKIFDCYRPFSIQQAFWKQIPDTRYVAKPLEENGKPVAGSRHNRGAAVDLTLVDTEGKSLEMPTDFDDFSEKAHRHYAGSLLIAQKHLHILEQAMKEEGFQGIATEWWHYDAEGWERYPIEDRPIDD